MTGPVTWTPVVDYRDIRYEHSGTGIAKVTIARPEVRCYRLAAWRPRVRAFAYRLRNPLIPRQAPPTRHRRKA